MKRLLFLFCLLITVACAGEEPLYNEETNVPANYSYFFTMIVGQGGIVSCLPTGLPYSGCRYRIESMDGIPIKVNKGSSATLKATPNDGYSFSGWSNGSNDLSIIVHFDSDITLTASFSLIEPED